MTPSPKPSVPDEQRLVFQPDEVADVLSYYDIGEIISVRDFPRGSRQSPKAHVITTTGEYLLKRRAAGRDDPYRVAFAHGLMLELMQRKYPVPALCGTRLDNNSILQVNDAVYELFCYVKGQRADRSPLSAALAGSMLGYFHVLLRNHRPEFIPSFCSYHRAEAVEVTTEAAVEMVCERETIVDLVDLRSIAGILFNAYDEAARRVDDLGFADWPVTMLHGDWHPGNMLLRDDRVVAILDLDSARIEPRMIDVSNGVLQFSMQMTRGRDPRQWPEGLADAPFVAFMRHYQKTSAGALESAEIAALPWLIIEALIVESLVPLATVGTFGGIPGSSFLQMIVRNVLWVRSNGDRLKASVEADSIR